MEPPFRRDTIRPSTSLGPKNREKGEPGPGCRGATQVAQGLGGGMGGGGRELGGSMA